MSPTLLHINYADTAVIKQLAMPGADLGILRGGGGGSGPEFFKGGGGVLRSRSAGIFIYWQAKKTTSEGGGLTPPPPIRHCMLKLWIYPPKYAPCSGLSVNDQRSTFLSPHARGAGAEGGGGQGGQFPPPTFCLNGRDMPVPPPKIWQSL